MKKILIFTLIFLNIFLINNITVVNDETISVFSSFDDSFNLYKLNTSTNSKNILKYINDEIKIIEIYPKISINLNNKIKQYVYKFNSSSNQNNIMAFEKEFRKLLISLNNNKEANLISFNGIDIDKVIIYTNEYNLNNLIKSNKFFLE